MGYCGGLWFSGQGTCGKSRRVLVRFLAVSQDFSSLPAGFLSLWDEDSMVL